MSLEMRTVCEKCGAPVTAGGEAYICSHECTFCRDCAEGMEGVCPNCGGELVRRPRRRGAAAAEASGAEAAAAACPVAAAPACSLE